MDNAQSQRILGSRSSNRTVALIVGDVISFLIFAAIGRNNHGEAAGLGALGAIAGTAGPFLLGWFVVAPFSGALRGNLFAQPRRLLVRTALTWLIAWPLGLGLRALFLQRAIPVSFAIVVGITNTIFLLGWRGIAAWLLNRRRDA